MKILRNILILFVPVYFIVTWLRNKLYDTGILTSQSYDVPVICVGNLSVGGTGKTPMIEYLIRLLRDSHRLATLSRGYKRHSKGFVLADASATALKIGDEPFQFFSKFNDIIVAVDANRRRGIENLLALEQAPEVILLDDAFQHRKVKAGLNILLSTYDDLYVDDMLLPTGNLREPKRGARRADIILVTKCPTYIGETEKHLIRKKLNPQAHQAVFFSEISYSEQVYSEKESMLRTDLLDKQFTLVTGIANAQPMVSFLKANGFKFEHVNYPDHHHYSDADIVELKKKDTILTTEKDFMRLKGSISSDRLYYLPIETQVSNGSDLDQLIRNFAAL
ncbi:MAG: tetraacyldisaccharide 4'-kinase [Bacteroidia bacterium]|nr:tetraacyldisaccharide 4'-kinase [Bacteroidia bacterium]MBT8278273.1 tetraacyldisaccharide 4'-kinase [Bacteroidia bacterium]NND26079.1 tetraacyldisaccharide 4'-kinase [Flavobacteriaceae bacterium]